MTANIITHITARSMLKNLEKELSVIALHTPDLATAMELVAIAKPIGDYLTFRPAAGRFKHLCRLKFRKCKV